MDDAEFRRRAKRFRDLHERARIFVLPNPWSVGTARLLANLGFEALATTSAGLAFSLGRRDGDGAVSADETFEHARQMIAATALPVSADLENGFGDAPEAVAATIRRAGEIGLAGGSIEDATYRVREPIFERSLALERIQAAVEAARGLPCPFVLAARADGFIRGRPDLDEILWRVQAYEQAGADVLYAPGLPDENALRSVCGSLSRPFNHVAGVGSGRWSLAQLAAFGVRRVTLGTSLARAALTTLLGAAREVLEAGTFGYLEGIGTVADFNDAICPELREASR